MSWSPNLPKNRHFLIFLLCLLNNGINFTYKCFIVLESYHIKEKYGNGNVVNYIWECIINKYILQIQWTLDIIRLMVLSLLASRKAFVCCQLVLASCQFVKLQLMHEPDFYDSCFLVHFNLPHVWLYNVTFPSHFLTLLDPNKHPTIMSNRFIISHSPTLCFYFQLLSIVCCVFTHAPSERSVGQQMDFFLLSFSFSSSTPPTFSAATN